MKYLLTTYITGYHIPIILALLLSLLGLRGLMLCLTLLPPQGAPGQSFLKSAEQGRIQHRATASAAAAAMNTAKATTGE